MASPRRAADDTGEIGLPVAPKRNQLSASRLLRKASAPLLVLGVLTMLGIPIGLSYANSLSLMGPSASPEPSHALTAKRDDLGVSSFAGSASASPSHSAKASETSGASSTPEKTPEPTKTPSPSPTPSPTTASPTPEATTAAPEPSSTPLPALGEVAGKLYATTSVNIRSGPGASYEKLGFLSLGDEIAVTAVTQNGWQQVKYDGKAAWVSAQYLSKEKPAVSAGFSTEPCSRAANAESGLTAQSVKVLRIVCNAFPNVTTFGGYRSDSGYHGKGQAIDIMVSGEAGWEIAKWARANSAELGVVEVLYAQQIWTTQRSSEGWRTFADRGSVSANHYDHVHLSIGS